jgi:hypothetical protein
MSDATGGKSDLSALFESNKERLGNRESGVGSREDQSRLEQLTTDN